MSGKKKKAFNGAAQSSKGSNWQNEWKGTVNLPSAKHLCQSTNIFGKVLNEA